MKLRARRPASRSTVFSFLERAVLAAAVVGSRSLVAAAGWNASARGCPPALEPLLPGKRGDALQHSYGVFATHFNNVAPNALFVELALDNATQQAVSLFISSQTARRMLAVFQEFLGVFEALRDILCVTVYWPLYSKATREVRLWRVCRVLGLDLVELGRCRTESGWLVDVGLDLVHRVLARLKRRWRESLGRVVPPASPEAVPLGELLFPAERSPGGACDLSSFRRPLHGGQRLRGRGITPWLDVTGTPTQHLSVSEILRRLAEAGVELSRFIVNLGAGMGECEPGPHYDPANCLVREEGFGGVLIEGGRHARMLEGFFAHRPDVAVHPAAITPQALPELLRDTACPESPDLLKIDVDNGDVDFFEAALTVSRPKVVHVEFIAVFPPPVVYREDFSTERLPGREDWRYEGLWSTSRFTGASAFNGNSLAAFVDAARGAGYDLLHVEYINAVFLRGDLPAAESMLSGRSARDLWRIGWLCSPLRRALAFSHERELARAFHIDFGRWADPSLADGELLDLAAEQTAGLRPAAGSRLAILDGEEAPTPGVGRTFMQEIVGRQHYLSGR